MRTYISLLLIALIPWTAIAQKNELKLKDVSAEDFRLAEEHKKTGLGEIGKVSFKFAPKNESPLETYFEHMDGTSSYTWHQTVEKKGRIFVNDTIAANGIALKLYVSGHQTPTFRTILYRLEGTKVKKIKIPATSFLTTEANDTIYYQVKSGGFQSNDILEVSYTIKAELNKAPIWYPINDISPRSVSQLDFITPSWLKYRFQFEGVYESELTKEEYTLPKSISVETWDSNNPDGSSKVQLRKLRNTYVDLHEVFTVDSQTTGPKLFIATLVEETKVNFR